MISCLWYHLPGSQVDEDDLKKGNDRNSNINAHFVLYFRIYIHCDDVFQ
jgi:hypothetical protein